METTSRHEARSFINNLRIDNGGITPEDIEFLERTRPHLLKSINALRQQLGASTKIVAEQLYHKKTRFVYELIQNAEDNRYSITVQPRLCFTLQQDRVIVDSNELGFTEKDIKAICSVGQSTKTLFQGYIGEKGIGFKSVFTVARKVHVQSEPYSFAFEYQREAPSDNGLGMVTPLNENHLPLPDGVRTRMILYLREGYDPKQLQQEFLDMPDTLLLFLKKLKQLSIHIELPDNRHRHIAYTLRSNDEGRPNNRVIIEKKDGQSTSMQNFWIKRRQVNDMPTDSARRNVHEAEVVLAFPVDANEDPVIEDQHVFAFLPLQKVGFKFLIQSDFITQASREDVLDSPWNQRLLKEVSKTFLRAVNGSDGFLRHPKMRYSWVRYIPTARILHDLWGQLQAKLLGSLRTQKLFFALDDQVESDPWSAAQLRVVTDRFKDQDLEPLLPDLDSGNTAYISDKYHSRLDLPIVRELGTVNLSIHDFLVRLEQDLELEDDSQLRWGVDDEWHTKVSNLLIMALEVPAQKKRVQKLKMIPLQGGDWVDSCRDSLFFPTSGGIKIPQDLPLNLVDEESLLNERRKTLFSAIGITECAPTTIFLLIEQRYLTVESIAFDAIVTCFQDVEFLFWHGDVLPPSYAIHLVTINGEMARVSNATKGSWIYSPVSKDSNSMFKLLGDVAAVPDELKDHVRFVHPDHYQTLGRHGSRNNRTGAHWLRDRVEIRQAPQLCRRNWRSSAQPEMSAELLYIAKYLPQHLLRVLKGNWPQYHESEEWDTKIREAKVPILNCSEPKALEMTHLPVSKLKAKVEKLDLSESFGFLEELDGMTDVQAAEWQILERFGVGSEDDVIFWLTLLKQARRRQSVRKHHVFEIYSRLQIYNEEEEVNKVREAFEEDLIYIPSDASSTDWTWTGLEYCAWSGPDWFSHYHCLENLSEYRPLSGLLVETLALSDANVVDFMDYLRHLKASQNCIGSEEENAKIPMIYGELNELAQGGSARAVKEQISLRIKEEELVYCPKTLSWQSPLSCIWAEDDIQLPGKFSLASSYKEQESFFRKVLGIEKPSLKMHVRALVQKASRNPDTEQILQEMRNICALNPAQGDLWTDLSDCACFPVRHPSGEIRWLSYANDFAVVDRSEYGNMFRNKIMTLNFSLEEVHSLKRFLLELDMGSKFLSKAVVEETRVQDGVLDEELTNDFRRKSYAICRYAAHFGAADVAARQSLLQRAEIYISDGIFRVASITQDNRTTTISEITGLFHLDQCEDQLKLYVPRDKKNRKVCFARQFPITLLKHLGIRHQEEGAKLGPIFSESSLSVVDEILCQDGIIEVDGVNRPEDGADSEDEIVVSVETSPLGSQGITRSVETPPYHERNTSSLSERMDRLTVATTNDNPFWTPATSVSFGSPDPPERPELYKEFLGVVIQQAENIESLPALGSSVVASVAADCTINPNLAVSSNVAGEDLFKIGAAGELFLYEILQHLGLPAFDTSCWKSTIRHRVAVHSRYQSMARWSGFETADIVYHDIDGVLTELLIRQGYLESQLWAGRTPTYYIEVKTTMGAVGNAFFCSQSQFERMEQMQLPDTGHADEVYMIARAFGLGGSRMGLRLYIDPATLRRKQELKFVADRYTITSFWMHGYR